MPRSHDDEDIFEGTKMTFGEHLEELRGALFRALIGLLVGTLVGFVVSDHVVKFIEGPLTEALEKYYQDQTETALAARYGQLDESTLDFVREQHLVFEDVLLERAELARLLSLGGGESVELEPGPPSADLVPTRLWRRIDTQIEAFNAQEGFLIWLKVGIYTGLVLAGPWIFWQIWMFVAAGLYPREKNYVYVFLPFSLGLFVLGAVVAFFFVFEPVLGFLFSFNAKLNINITPRISEWLGFVLMLPLGFGISFQLPLVMLFLNRIGIFSIAAYLSKWRIAVLVIFVIAMILTPADPMSMLLLAAPLTLLYFLGVALCKWMPRRTSPFGEGYDPA
jgi:sec-independent protein translocase protein TatC